MVSLHSLFHPVKDGTQVRLVPRPPRRVAPPPAPTAEAYASPLQTEVRAIVAARLRECRHLCTGCKYSAGNGCTLDTRLAAAVKDLEDPLPFLKGLDERLSATEAELQRTQKALEAAQRFNKPSNRVRLGAYYQAGAITLLTLWELFKITVLHVP